MAVTIPEVNSANIRHCLLIKLTIGLEANTYYISNAWKTITYDGNDYTELGALLNVGDFREDIKTTNGDINISLSGIPSNENYVQLITNPATSNSSIKGGEVQVDRAFFDEQYNVSNVYQRFKGIITNFAISEDEDLFEDQLTNSIEISCASINTLLENRVAGQRTNPTDRNKFFSGDATFNRVPDLHNVNFDFGREYQAGGGYGGGGGCFSAGTLIAMADGSLKPIENVIKGDLILSYNFEKHVTETDVVDVVTKPIVDQICELNVNGQFIWCTPDHPFYVKGKGWSSMFANQTYDTHGMSVEEYVEGDVFTALSLDKELHEAPLRTMRVKTEPRTKTYNLSKVKNNQNYFANGLLVHNKGGRGGGGGGNNQQLR